MKTTDFHSQHSNNKILTSVIASLNVFNLTQTKNTVVFVVVFIVTKIKQLTSFTYKKITNVSQEMFLFKLLILLTSEVNARYCTKKGKACNIVEVPCSETS